MSDNQTIRVRDRRKPGWHWIDNDLIDVFAIRIGVYALAVYEVLARYANENGEAFPSIMTIAEKLGCSDRQVQKMLEKLEEVRLIEKSLRFAQSGAQASNMYYLLDIDEARRLLMPPGEPHSPPGEPDSSPR